MRGNGLLEKMELISPEYIESAERPHAAKGKAAFIGAAAACLCVAAIGAVLLPHVIGKGKPYVDVPRKETERYIGNYESETETVASGGIGAETEEKKTFPGVAEMISMMSKAGEEMSGNSATGGGMFLLDREYQDITYNIAYLEKLYRGEAEIVDPERVTEWINESFLKKSEEEQRELPTMYLAIRELGITKEDLVRLNDSRKPLGSEMILEDSYIDALYADEEEMKKLLVNPLALLHEGRIYTWETVVKMSPEELDAAGIDGETLFGYMERVRDYCTEHGLVGGEILDRYIAECRGGN